MPPSFEAESPSPMPKWPFFAGDVVLIGVGLVILLRHADPDPSEVAVAALCVFLGVALAVLPFVLDALRHLRAEQLAAQRQAEALAVRFSQLVREIEAVRASAQESAEKVGSVARAVEDVPFRVRDAVEDLRRQIGQRESDGGEKLAMVSDLLERAVTRLGEVERALAERIPQAVEAADRFGNLAHAVDEEKFADLRAENAALREQLAASRTARAAVPEKAMPEPASAVATDEAPAVVARDEAPASTRGAPAAEAADAPEPTAATTELGFDVPVAAKLTKFRPPAGAGAVIARAYIGIGNRLFVRGEGAGLRRDKGVPMQFVEIGKWGWAAPAGESARVSIWRNDEIAAAEGEVLVQAGEVTEVSPTFSL